MQILYTRLVDEPERAGTQCLATIDLEVSPDLRLYGLRLLRMADGEHRLFAPQIGQRSGARRVASFSTDLAKRLTDMALRAVENIQDVG